MKEPFTQSTNVFTVPEIEVIVLIGIQRETGEGKESWKATISAFCCWEPWLLLRVLLSKQLETPLISSRVTGNTVNMNSSSSRRWPPKRVDGSMWKMVAAWIPHFLCFFCGRDGFMFLATVTQLSFCGSVIGSSMSCKVQLSSTASICWFINACMYIHQAQA